MLLALSVCFHFCLIYMLTPENPLCQIQPDVHTSISPNPNLGVKEENAFGALKRLQDYLKKPMNTTNGPIVPLHEPDRSLSGPSGSAVEIEAPKTGDALQHRIPADIVL
jgi:hypothetical protein